MNIMKRLGALNKKMEENANKYPTEKYSKEGVEEKRKNIINLRKQMASLNY